MTQKNLFLWREKVERERARRTKLAVAAYAYEFESDPIMSDYDFDMESKLVNVNLDTGNPVMDKFFKEHFDPSTGNWIKMHPDLQSVAYIYHKYYKKQDNPNIVKWN